AGSEPRWLLYDGHGSTRQLASATGTVTSRYSYEAYGLVQTATSSSPAESAPTSLLYCGEQYDSVLRMYNLRARFYDPSNGRFTARDTFVGNNFDPQSLHKYAYCHCDPVNGTDPSGQVTLIGLIIRVAIVVVVAYAVVQVYHRLVQPVYQQYVAQEMDPNRLEGAMNALGKYAHLNQKVGLLVQCVRDGYVHVYVLPRGGVRGGSHNLLTPGRLYISQNTLDQRDDLATGLVIFGEFQHDPLSGEVLDEAAAQREFSALREGIQRINPAAITPYIKSLQHGYW
ncbi:MAG: RHS repeat-associated core domain-containing protein, partial [Bacteroidota bacterium]|nr:RHS repeat-associated core domain-containing protein [Bacteroidota bacterium]